LIQPPKRGHFGNDRGRCASVKSSLDLNYLVTQFSVSRRNREIVSCEISSLFPSMKAEREERETALEKRFEKFFELTSYVSLKGTPERVLLYRPLKLKLHKAIVDQGFPINVIGDLRIHASSYIII